MKSYLLALDGSRESLLAAELAWKLAAANDAKVVAQTVVDPQSLWQIIGKDLPGIIGNGYLAAHESMCAALKTISEALLGAYEARARGHNVSSESFVDEGNILDQINKRLKEHAFVIMGHQRERRGPSEQASCTIVCERLAYVCPKPLLIVQDECELWKTARLIVSEDTYDATVLSVFLDFAKGLNLSQEIYCIAPEQSIAKFTATVRNSISPSEHVHFLSPNPEEGDPVWECATDVPSSTLLVVATQGTNQGRTTCAGTDPGTFIHRSRYPLVILPESKRTVEFLSSDDRTKSLSKKG